MTPSRGPHPPEIAQPERLAEARCRDCGGSLSVSCFCCESPTEEAQRYARETEAAAREVFRVRSLSMLRASLEHPSALPTLELFPGLAKPVQERLW